MKCSFACEKWHGEKETKRAYRNIVTLAIQRLFVQIHCVGLLSMRERGARARACAHFNDDKIIKIVNMKTRTNDSSVLAFIQSREKYIFYSFRSFSSSSSSFATCVSPSLCARFSSFQVCPYEFALVRQCAWERERERDRDSSHTEINTIYLRNILIRIFLGIQDNIWSIDHSVMICGHQWRIENVQFRTERCSDRKWATRGIVRWYMNWYYRLFTFCALTPWPGSLGVCAVRTHTHMNSAQTSLTIP